MNSCNNVEFGGKATYKIVVKGKVEEEYSVILGGLSITFKQDSTNNISSELTGLIMDQAALSGILNTLFELHKPVISVECIKSE